MRTPRPSRPPVRGRHARCRSAYLQRPQDAPACAQGRRQQRALVPLAHDGGSASPRRGSSSEAIVTVSPVSMTPRVAVQWSSGNRRPTQASTTSPSTHAARHSTSPSSCCAHISQPLASSSAQTRRHAESSTVRGSRLELNSRLSSFSSRSCRARASSSTLRRCRSWNTRALCTAADAWLARPIARSSSSEVNRRSRSVSQMISTPSVISPNRSGSERQVFSPHSSMDARLCASSAGSDRVSRTGSRLKRISRSLGLSTSSRTASSMEKPSSTPKPARSSRASSSCAYSQMTQ